MIEIEQLTETNFMLTLKSAKGQGYLGLKPRSYNLLYGAVCPFCTNVIAAQVIHEDQFPDLWGYEETVIMKHKSQIGTMETSKHEKARILPDYKVAQSETKMVMEVMTDKNMFGAGYVTTLRLTNHIYEPSILSQIPTNRFEKGDKPCLYGGFMSFNREMAMRYALMGARVIEPTGNTNRFDYNNLDKMENFLMVESLKGYAYNASYKIYSHFMRGVGPIATWYGMFDITYLTSFTPLFLPNAQTIAAVSGSEFLKIE